MSPPPPATPQHVLDWGNHAHGSPLYQHLVGVVASDPELMRILNRIEHLPRPNLLFGGVQFMLLARPHHDLAGFYPSIADQSQAIAEIDGPFRDFVLSHEEELVAIGASRFTQTNECRRCAALLPMIWMSGFDRFHLIDLGTSAGLNLALDRYVYQWDELVWGDGSVVIEAVSRGMAPRPGPIAVLSRTGLDVSPIDPSSEEDRRWLDALIWPELHERRARLRAALDVLTTLDFDLVTGDALETLAPTLSALPPGEPAVVLNSFVLNQLTPDQRGQIDQIVQVARSERPVFRASMEILTWDEEWAQLVTDDGSGPVHVGQAHPHGEWIDLSLLED